MSELTRPRPFTHRVPDAFGDTHVQLWEGPTIPQTRTFRRPWLEISIEGDRGFAVLTEPEVRALHEMLGAWLDGERRVQPPSGQYPDERRCDALERRELG